MARRARLIFAGVPQHIIQRGNNRQATFFAEGDYRCYLDWLHEAAKKYGCRIYAYVLMTNHVHLLASAQRPYDLSRMMQHLGLGAQGEDAGGVVGNWVPRSESGLLFFEQIHWPLVGLPVDAHIGDGIEPKLGGGVDGAEIEQLEAIEEVRLHIRARILAALPESRLVLCIPEGAVRQEVVELFSRHGVKAAYSAQDDRRFRSKVTGRSGGT